MRTNILLPLPKMALLSLAHNSCHVPACLIHFLLTSACLVMCFPVFLMLLSHVDHFLTDIQ